MAKGKGGLGGWAFIIGVIIAVLIGLPSSAATAIYCS